MLCSEAWPELRSCLGNKSKRADKDNPFTTQDNKMGNDSKNSETFADYLAEQDKTEDGKVEQQPAHGCDGGKRCKDSENKHGGVSRLTWNGRACHHHHGATCKLAEFLSFGETQGDPPPLTEPADR